MTKDFHISLAGEVVISDPTNFMLADRRALFDFGTH